VSDEKTDEGKHCEVCGEPLDGETTTVPTGEAHLECAEADPMSGDELMPDGGRRSIKAECGSCGFRDCEAEFDERGMDTACPVCGSSDIEEVDDAE
jgi:Zn finger protein HypA/HybF involved in hydrogenase expression